MSGVELLIFALSLTACAAGLFLLFTAWKNRNSPISLSGGWALLLLAMVLSFIANSDRGVAQVSVIAMMLVSVFFIYIMTAGLPSLDFEKSRRKVEVEPENPAATGLKVLGSLWTFIVTGPLAGMIALFAGATVFRFIMPEDGNPITAGVICIILSATLWAVLSTFLLIEKSPIRRTLYAVGAVIVTGATAFI
ncbi:hypothetical protein [Ponticaulis sp.]|uniref:hypothetical protein n=1 Tax=Ponticaulis sp. TaxID=2020902 RepID=UPI000B64CB85|nr:hypothetical protein [Ponticaulis sp.]MAI90512.1 hypothetical protein [Ponticaulis sp.]OUY00207.1 MAG: hypothetical protein CBB65_08745 [Hyphomonadaceae bacterium TMED5]